MIRSRRSIDLEHVEELERLHLEAEGAVHHQQHQVRHLGC